MDWFCYNDFGVNVLLEQYLLNGVDGTLFMEWCSWSSFGTVLVKWCWWNCGVETVLLEMCLWEVEKSNTVPLMTF